MFIPSFLSYDYHVDRTINLNIKSLTFFSLGPEETRQTKFDIIFKRAAFSYTLGMLLCFK